MRAFISYSRADYEIVEELYEGIADRHGHPTFLDTESLRGGEEWWNRILREIRECQLFIFALSPNSVRSKPCREELDYALTLKKPVRVVLVREMPPGDLLLEEIKLVNWDLFVNPAQREETIAALDDVLDEFKGVRPTTIAESDLPRPPKPPITDLAREKELVERDELDAADQSTLIEELAHQLKEPDQRGEVFGLLELFKERHHDHLTTANAELVDDLIRRYREAPSASKGLLRPLVSNAGKGVVAPILGSGMTDWLLGSRRELATAWAADLGYPLGERYEDLPQVAQFALVTQPLMLLDDLGRFYKQMIQQRFPGIFGVGAASSIEEMTIDEMVVDAWESKSPSQNSEPHRVVARLNCKIYITTDMSSILEHALIRAGKTPRSGYSKWRADQPDWPTLNTATLPWPAEPFDTDPSYEPTPQEPLVFHVFGVLGVRDSLVITEDDYLDFLVAAAGHRHAHRAVDFEDIESEGRGENSVPPPPGGLAGNRAVLPVLVQEELAQSNLLFLGFSALDWDVRVLLRALFNPQTTEHLNNRKKFLHVAAAIDVPNDTMKPREAKEYLDEYFKDFGAPPINLYWSSVERFATDLSEGLKARP